MDPKTRRCHARSKGRGEQCRKWARRGYRVCSSHGAGTRKRVVDGSRSDPAVAGAEQGLRNIRTGLYVRDPATAAAHFGPSFQEQLDRLREEGANVDEEIALLRLCVCILLEHGAFRHSLGIGQIARTINGVVRACLAKHRIERRRMVDVQKTVIPLLEEFGALMRGGIDRFVADEAARELFASYIRAGIRGAAQRCFDEAASGY